MALWSSADWKSNPSKLIPLHLPLRANWIKILATVLLWTVASAYVTYSSFPDFYLALLDASSLSFFVLVGFWLLGNIFSFYNPQKAQFWIVLTLPAILAVCFTALEYYAFTNLLSQTVGLGHYLKTSLLLKGSYLFLMYFFWSILLVVTGKLEDQRAMQEKEEKSQQLAKEAELYYLRQQLQPHFLFNSLNSINALIKAKPEKARDMLVQLAEFLRSTIRQDSSKLNPISQEVEQLKIFLDIEKVRFGERLMVDFEISQDAENLMVPQLLIQPLLENAIKHSLYGLTGQVNIQLRITKEGNFLYINISNPYNPQAGQAKGSGFGLEGVKRRLFLMFGRSDLIKTLAQNGYFVVHLRIPQS